MTNLTQKFIGASIGFTIGTLIYFFIHYWLLYLWWTPSLSLALGLALIFSISSALFSAESPTLTILRTTFQLILFVSLIHQVAIWLNLTTPGFFR